MNVRHRGAPLISISMSATGQGGKMTDRVT